MVESNSGSSADLTSNDPREALTALRDLLVERILEAEPRDTASLARQLESVYRSLASLPGEEKSGLDELRERRERASEAPKPARRRNNSGGARSR